MNGKCMAAPGLDDAMPAHLLPLESPMKQKTKEMEEPRIAEEDNIHDLKKTNEKKSSSPSRSHSGLWKSNSQDEIFHTTWKMLGGWKQALGGNCERTRKSQKVWKIGETSNH